jgi:hypothetical protein
VKAAASRLGSNQCSTWRSMRNGKRMPGSNPFTHAPALMMSCRAR